MKKLEEAPSVRRMPLRRLSGGIALVLLLAGCDGERGSPATPTGEPSLQNGSFFTVAAAQSPPPKTDRPRAETSGEAGAGETPSVREPPQRTSKAPDGSEVEDETYRDFSKRDCLAAGCHGGLTETLRVHGPVAVGACHLCHEADGEPREHRFKTTRSREELCSLCHRPAAPLAVVHEPYGKSACADCHNPHGGADTKFLRAETLEKSCRACHERGEATTTHKPIAEGDCLACHAPHQSSFKHLLVAEGSDLCLGCHMDLLKTFKESAHVHGAVVEECTNCHQAHGSEHVALLRQMPQQLCTGCHEETARGAEGARSGHAFTNDGGGEARCSSCHRPHASEFDKLLIASPGEICFSCHDREIRQPSGRVIPSVRQQVAAAKSVHEPVASGACGACHYAHFSSRPSLLTKPYPADFYAEFVESAYELCFSCHDSRLVLEERTSRTQFRDGDRNLHHLHVNRRKGRTCGVCHEPHGGPQPALLRDSVPFGAGDWRLPIRFERTTTGGTCASGCHQSFAYDNTSPPPAPREKSRPKSAPPPALQSAGGNGE